MGLLPALRDIETGGSPMRLVDAHGRTLLRLPAEFAGGEIEVLHGDLAKVPYERSLPYTEYVFGDSITGLTETSAPASGSTSGAGSHASSGWSSARTGRTRTSVVSRSARREDYVSHLGYYAATWRLPKDLALEKGSVGYNVPGRLASVGADHRDPVQAGAFFAFDGLGWEVPRLLASLREAPELCFDSISRADVDTWSKGRVCLVGDAACGATIGGMGSGTALVTAYLLACELARAQDNHRAAFTSPATSAGSGSTPKAARRAAAAPASSSRRAQPPAYVCVTRCCPAPCS
ncbi:Rossmann-fold NAD(P)-binding domain-containing protein [Streptomyces niveus]|uniref:hypothetical protein n=1 Tax=Streptomyces niveus TaxID=193462 RepID=UPI00368C66C8